MTKNVAKSVLRYLDRLSDKLTTKEEFDEMAIIMSLVEQEIEKANLKEDRKMTIADVRKIYPHSDFYFFKDGLQMQKAPFFHDAVKDFEEVNSTTVFVHM